MHIWGAAPFIWPGFCPDQGSGHAQNPRRQPCVPLSQHAPAGNYFSNTGLVFPDWFNKVHTFQACALCSPYFLSALHSLNKCLTWKHHFYSYWILELQTLSYKADSWTDFQVDISIDSFWVFICEWNCQVLGRILQSISVLHCPFKETQKCKAFHITSSLFEFIIPFNFLHRILP